MATVTTWLWAKVKFSIGFYSKREGNALDKNVVGFSITLANLPKPVTNSTISLSHAPNN